MAVRKHALAAVLAAGMSLVLASSLFAGVALADAGSSYAAARTGGKVGLATQAKQKGWVATSAGTSYYRNGEKVTGLQKIGKSRYYFNAKGILKTSDVRVGGVTYYVDGKGKLIGAKMGGKNYYNTLKRMSSADSYDFDTYLQARSIVKKITNASDSDQVKLRKAFNWVMEKGYEIHRTFDPFTATWTAVYARDHFNDIGGDCHSDAAAFAYLAAAIGYPADVCLDAVMRGTPGSHAWCMIGNKVYDPLFAQSKSYDGYYGVTSGTYETNPTARYRVPRYNPKNAAKGAKASTKLANAGTNGLRKVGAYYCFYKNGAKLKNAWKTVDGKRYYFKANGRAATLSTKVKGSYYVFDKKGVLQNSATSGTRVVKIGSSFYQVNKKGKAVAGFSSDGTRRFGKTGLLLTGVHVVDGKLYAADSAGVYQLETTEKLQVAAVRGGKASSLRALLGAPKEESYAASCRIAGDDGIWVYDHIMVTTARPTGASDDADNFEYVWSVEER